MPEFPTVALEMEFATDVWTDVIADVIGSDNIRVNYGIRGFLPLQRTAGTGSMDFSLNNSENNSGGLLGYYTPGHANVRTGFDIGIGCRLKLTYDGTDYYKFHGTIRDITPQAGTYGERKTIVRVTDWLHDASLHKVDLVSIQTDRRSDQVIQDILDNMTKSPPVTDLATGQETFGYAHDGLKDEKTSALAAIQRVTLSEFGFSYVIGNNSTGGVFTFEDRHTRIKNKTVEATLSGSHIAGLSVERTDKNIFNVIRAKSNPRDVGTTNEVLYSLQNPIEIGTNSVVTVIARYRDPNQGVARISGTDMVTPVADTDYEFGSSEGSGNNDKNSDLSITVTFGANSAELVLHNTSVTGGYLNKMQLRGKAIRLFDPMTSIASDSTSQANYGDRPLDLNLLYIESPLVSKDYGDHILGRWKDPQTLIKSVSFHANQDATRLVDALEVEPGSRVDLTDLQTAIDGEYFVNGISFEIRPKDWFYMTWYPTPASLTEYWTLGSSKLGTDTRLAF